MLLLAWWDINDPLHDVATIDSCDNNMGVKDLIIMVFKIQKYVIKVAFYEREIIADSWI